MAPPCCYCRFDDDGQGFLDPATLALRGRIVALDFPLGLRDLPAHPELARHDHPHRAERLEGVVQGRAGRKPRSHEGVRHDHLGADTPQDGPADQDDHRVAVHQGGEQVAGVDDDGDAHAQAEDQQKQVPPRRPGHGQHVVERHGHIGDQDDLHGLPQGARLLLPAPAVVGLHEELHRDPQDQRPADELDEVESPAAGPRTR